MRRLWLVVAAWACLSATARAQPGVIHGLPPSEPGRVGASWSPLGAPLREVPRCGEPPPIEEWRAVEPHRRWLVAQRAGVSVPGWPNVGCPARVMSATDRRRELLALEETYYSAPDDRAAYASLAPGCSELREPPDWWSAMRNVVAAFHCPAERSFILFATHTDGLVLRATIPSRDGRAPDCAGLLLMASLVPLRAEARACSGRCSYWDGLLQSDHDAVVFEETRGTGLAHVRPFFEVVPVARDRFEVVVYFASRPSRPEPGWEPASLSFLGSELRAAQWLHEGERFHRAASVGLRLPGRRHEAPWYALGVSVTGSAGAFERGLRFVESLFAAGPLTEYDLVMYREKQPGGSLPKSAAQETWVTVEGVALLAALVTAALIVRMRVRTRRRSDRSQRG